MKSFTACVLAIGLLALKSQAAPITQLEPSDYPYAPPVTFLIGPAGRSYDTGTGSLNMGLLLTSSIWPLHGEIYLRFKDIAGTYTDAFSAPAQVVSPSGWSTFQYIPYATASGTMISFEWPAPAGYYLQSRSTLLWMTFDYQNVAWGDYAIELPGAHFWTGNRSDSLRYEFEGGVISIVPEPATILLIIVSFIPLLLRMRVVRRRT